MPIIANWSENAGQNGFPCINTPIDVVTITFNKGTII